MDLTDQMFSNENIGLDEAGHIALACKQASELAKFDTLLTFIGEVRIPNSS